MRSFICMWIGELAMKVWMRIDFARLERLAGARTSFSLARARAHTVLSLIAFAMACTASKSPLDDGGKAGLDDVDAQPLELARDARLFFLRHRRAGALLAVAQRRVENDQVVGHGGPPRRRWFDQAHRRRARRAPARPRMEARFTAATTAFSDAVTMFGSSPTPKTVRSPVAQFHVGHRRRVLAGARRVLVVVEHVDVDAGAVAQRMDERVDRAVARARQPRRPVDHRAAPSAARPRRRPAVLARWST